MRALTDMIPPAIAAGLAATGRHWAKLEYDLAQEFDRPYCAWTRGAWCGDTSQLDGIRDDSEEFASNRETIETLIDDAASAAWEELWKR